MIKELGKYIVNGESAVFNALVENTTFKTRPVAVFTFEDGYQIKCVHDNMTGITTMSAPMEPGVRYHEGNWEFIK